MAQYNTTKNPPWARQAGDYPSPQIVPPPMAQQQMLNQAVVQYPQVTAAPAASVYQAQLALQQQALSMQQMVANNAQQLYNTQVNPARQLNPAFAAAPVQQVAAAPQTQNAATSTKQRVFTGTVTKIQDTFGFVDEEVFFQISCVKGTTPVVNDRVLVEAMYIPNMPFKWNATRVQVLPMNDSQQKKNQSSSSSGYNAVAPPETYDEGRNRERDRDRDRQRERSPLRRRSPVRRRSPINHDADRRRRRRDSEERDSRRRSRSPKRPRFTEVKKYKMRIPEYSLMASKLTVFEVRSRYSEMYIPSDFLSSIPKWMNTFPPSYPMSITTPCQFFVTHKDIDPPVENTAVLEPPDADYIFSSKVMLLSFRTFDEYISKCVPLPDDEDKDSYHSYVHPTRLINCLVGVNTRGKNETMAIGGPWSPSSDGSDPTGDPNVLIKTAIRTCKALTGIDLTPCTKWYRFAEIYYHRSKSTHKGKEIPARIETVVLYIPDVWSLTPTQLEWGHVVAGFNQLKQIELNQNGDNKPVDENDKEDENASVIKREPTHYNLLDPKTMKVSELREELEARNMSSKGLRLQLVARLVKLLKTEQEAADEAKNKKNDEDEKKEALNEEQNVKELSEEKEELPDKRKARIEEKYQIPENPHILVYPSKTAKGGKFTCKKMSLSLLLDYRPGDNKEHSFEVSLFAELFNEMLMRDFGIKIYKALLNAPEKDEKDEKRDEKEKTEEKEIELKQNGEKDEKKSNDDKKNEKNNDDKSNNDDDKERGSKDRDNSADRDKKRRDDRKDRDKERDRRRREEKKKYYTADPMLLLAFMYFDVTRFGCIYDNDLERLLQILGLHLTRAQAKKIMSKVLSRDSSCNYRKLTDLPVIEGVEKVQILPTEPNVEDLFQCNLPDFQLTPIKKEKDLTPTKRATRGRGAESSPVDEKPKTDDGLILYKGALVNIDNLHTQLEKNEKTRLDTEKKLVELQGELVDVKDKAEKSSVVVKDLSKELSICKAQLNFTKEKLAVQAASSDVYVSVLMDIQERLIPVLDPGEIKRLTKIRQDIQGAPQINLVPLTKVEEILQNTPTEEESTIKVVEVKSKSEKSSKRKRHETDNDDKMDLA